MPPIIERRDRLRPQRCAGVELVAVAEYRPQRLRDRSRRRDAPDKLLVDVKIFEAACTRFATPVSAWL